MHSSRSCCNMIIDKIEIIIAPKCRGQIKTLSVNGKVISTSYGTNSYATSTYPAVQDPTYQVLKVRLYTGSGRMYRRWGRPAKAKHTGAMISNQEAYTRICVP